MPAISAPLPAPAQARPTRQAPETGSPPGRARTSSRMAAGCAQDLRGYPRGPGCSAPAPRVFLQALAVLTPSRTASRAASAGPRRSRSPPAAARPPTCGGSARPRPGSGRSKAWPLLIVASVVRNVTRDRRQAGEPEPDTLQQYMEGNIIRRCGIVPEITEWGGERLASSSAMSPGCSCVPSRRRPD
jgi:hypothetical protein